MILLIDNYDSFTYNLLHYLGELGADVKVIRNDAVTIDEILNMSDLEGIILSPGPCTPDKSGICLDLVKSAAGKYPILGVCLGHEVIAQVFGGRILRAPEPVHGKVSDIIHQGSDIFMGIPSSFKATRYHSLMVDKESCPEELRITAFTKDGIIMAIEHKTHKIYGVQFHPESIASEYGHDILKNFLKII